MKRKPIKIDWEDLEEAFTQRPGESPSQLDLVTGHVVLEGEGEKDDFDDEEDDAHYERRVAAGPPPRNDSTLLKISPPDTPEKIEWLHAFLATDHELNPDVVSQLEEALGADNPGTQLSAIMNANSDERDAWYAYRADQVRKRIEKWLEDNGVQSIDPPPWNSA